MPQPIRDDRDVMEYDVLIVGAGPAGLACAIRLKQLNTDRNVCIIEKGSEVGAHLLSGAVFEPRSLNELLPDWQQMDAPINVPVKGDKFKFLTKLGSFGLPTPPQMHNKGNYIVSLSEIGRWLAGVAENLGVEIYPQTPGAEILYNEDGAVIGVATGDMGVERDGSHGDRYTPGMELHGKQVILAEGCHGSLTKLVTQKFDLRKNSDPQTYALGIKEVWEVDESQYQEGMCTHTIGWPMDTQTYGGSFIYHWRDNLVSVGYVTALDYKNPYLSPFEEMQRFKTHPDIKPLFEGARRVAYGARALVEGGLQSLPQLTFPGGMLIGDSAGFLNVPKIKGNHAAIKSGMLAAEAINGMGDDAWGQECTAYADMFKKSWLYKELYKVRNIRPGFRFGLVAGLIHAAFQTFGGWLLPYTLKNHADYAQTGKASDYTSIDYPKPDGVLTFDRLSSLPLSNTNHAEDQPPHLKLRDVSVPISKNLPDYAEPATRYCPAAVYEIVEEGGEKKFQINAQNCVHCKTCDIKDPSQNIDWTTPQGGGGPNYSMT